MPDADFPLLTFANAASFARWLASQPSDCRGAWLKFAKKGAPEATILKSEAVDVALAHGWIDGRLGGVDAHYFKTRFTPRKAASAWSKRNRARAEDLIASGQMTQAGLAQVDRAKADGRWDAAYPSQGAAVAPDDFLAALENNAPAKKRFEALDAANRYAILYRIHRTKTAAKRADKIADMVAMLQRGETIHPRRGKRTSRE